MFWHHPDWIEIDDAQLPRAVDLIRTGLPAHERDLFSLRPETGAAEAAEARLLVSAMRWRRLDFYTDHWLYELTIALADTAFANRYESARAFIVVTADSGTPDAGRERAPHVRAPGGVTGVRARQLTWSADVLHALNDSAGLRLAPDGRMDAALTTEYLDFFVSFIGGGDGEHHPFLLPRGGTLAEPQGIARRPGLPSFEQAVREQVLNGRPLLRPSRFDTPEDPGRMDAPDDVAPEPAGGAAGPVGEGAAATAAGSTTGSGDEAVTAAGQVIAGIRFERERAVAELDTERGEQAVAELSAMTLYQGTWFRTRFAVAQQAPFSTAVSMIEDAPLAEADTALLQHFVDTLHVDGVRLLLCLKPRMLVRAEEFIQQVRRAAAAKVRSSATTLANLRVSGDVHLRQLEPHGAIHVRDVEFLGHVVMDECRRDASVTFEHCQFARGFAARHAHIEGDLVLRGSHVWGVATAGHAGGAPAVHLAGLRLSGDLEAAALEVEGELDATSARIGGRLDLRGVDVLPHTRYGKAITLRNAHVTAAVDLTPRVRRESGMKQSIRRTRVEGLLDMAGLHGDEVLLCGASLGLLELGYAQIGGCVDMTCHDPAANQPEPARLRAPMLRTTVAGYANLRFLRASEVWVVGARIGGELNLLGAEIDGSLFSRHGTLQGYRLVVDDEVTLSGAHIRGDVDLCGARIRGPVVMRTGSLGRLFLSVSPLLTEAGDEITVGHFPAEVGQVELVGVRGLVTVNLCGLRCNPAAEHRHGIVLEHIECAGDINFYWGQSEERSFGAAGARAHECLRARQRTDAGEERPPGRVRRAIGLHDCEARVGGDVVMRRVVTGGFIDLTNLRLDDGSVRLNDARIGTDLFARASWLRGDQFERSARHDRAHCQLSLRAGGLDLDNARIGGDALLAGMHLARTAGGGDGSLRARGLQVGGNLELHAGSGCGARIDGAVLLSGLRATDLSLPGADALLSTPGAVVLEGARLGGLAIDEPIPRLNMTGITVESWKLGQRDGGDEVAAIVAILSHMQPMDRSVWTSVESRLRNEARVADADRVYRTMRRLEPVTPWGAAPRWLSRTLFGFGTRVWPAMVLWLALSAWLFAVLARPDNVKLAEGALLQLAAQCSRVEEVMPQKCRAYAEGVLNTAAPTLELTAAQLAATGGGSGYGWGDAALLGLRYGVPLIGGFGDSEWEPVEQRPAAGPLAIPGVAPSIAAAVTLLLNTLLLSFTAAFVARRWLR